MESRFRGRVHKGRTKLVSRDIFELADGSRTKELVFQGSVSLAGRTRTARILINDSQDTLIGTRLLAGCLLTVDFRTGKVQLKRK